MEGPYSFLEFCKVLLRALSIYIVSGWRKCWYGQSWSSQRESDMLVYGFRLMTNGVH